MTTSFLEQAFLLALFLRTVNHIEEWQTAPFQVLELHLHHVEPLPTACLMVWSAAGFYIRWIDILDIMITDSIEVY